jgi:hypothetical protein
MDASGNFWHDSASHEFSDDSAMSSPLSHPAPDPAAGSSAPRERAARLMSLDALRGFDMFWIGMNPITIYMLGNLVDIGGIAERLVGGELGRLCFGRYSELVVALVSLGLVFGVARFMYRRKIFLRL